MTPRTPALALLLLSACSSSHPAALPTPSATATPSASPTPSPTASPTPSPTPTNEDPLSPRPAIESPAPLGQPTCRAAAVTVTDADAVFTDHAAQELFVLRTDGKPCQLKGWPTVTLLDAGGHALPVTVRHGGFDLASAPPAPVTLSGDTSLSFFVATSRTGACVAAATLRVTLPGTTTARTAPTTMSVCDRAVGVSPVQRLADSEGTPD